MGITGMILTLLYFAAMLTVFYFILMEYGLALGALVFVVMSLIYVWFIYGLGRGTSPKRRKPAVQPQQQPKPRAFNGNTLIALAALVSDNDPDLVNEVSESVLNFQEYTGFYRSEEWLSDTVDNEKYWERWYPNNKTDPVYMSEYIDDKPMFCCLNMLEWLDDKGYAAGIDVKWECEELVHSAKKLADKKKLPLAVEEIEWLPDETTAVYTHENLAILNEHLCASGYRLINLDRGGDCYDLAIVSESVHNKIMHLDLEDLGGCLTVESF